MLKIGQVRKDLSQHYLEDLQFTPTTVNNRGYEDTSGQDDNTSVFTDFALQYNFRPGTSYYIRVKIKRIEEGHYDSRYGNADIINFSLVFYEDNGGDDGKHVGQLVQTVEKNIQMGPYIEGHNDTWQSFSFVVTPNAEYQYLCFKINRIGYDYVYNKTADERKPFIYGETMDFDTDGDVCEIKDILPRSTVDKIGIQSRPGTLFCVNQEPIVLGRSGVYEVNNGTRITSVGVIAPNGSDTQNIQDFILDYAWDTSLNE